MPTTDWEHLPFGLIEELKAKNLYYFVVPEESSCNKITIEVYKNEKYRNLAGDWGSIIGVHIFPAVDRRPLTNEKGSKYINCGLSEIEPLSGFKWVDDWTVITKENVTDEEGYQYAFNWKNLRQGKSIKHYKDNMCWVRRQKLRRVMVVDLQSSRSLPYELTVHFTTTANHPNATPNPSHSYYVELLVDGVVAESGVIAAPSFSKDLTYPFTHLARYRQVEIRVSKNNAGSQAPVHKNFTFGEIFDSLDKLNSQSIIENSATLLPFTVIMMQDKAVKTQAEIRINENTIFNVVNTDQYFAEGQVNEIAMSGSKISQRLRGKIIMLSLDLQCNFNGLLKDITILTTDSQSFITDFDLINILDDINQIQGSNRSGRNDLGKVMSYLREAETARQELFYLFYPNSMPLFTKWIAFQHFQGEQDLSGMNKELLQRIMGNYYYMKKWFYSQPVCSPTVMKHYHLEWQREIGAQRQFIYRIYLFKQVDDYEGGGTGEHATSSPSYGILWSNIRDYYQCLKYLSCIKYNITPDVNAVTQVNAMITVEGRSFQQGLVYFDFQEEVVEISVQNLDSIEDQDDKALFPVRLSFEMIDAVEISHAHALTMSHLLEVKLISVTSFQVAASSAAFEHQGHIDIDTMDGQHYGVDFKISQESMSGSNQPATASLQDTVRVLIPHWVAQVPQREIDPVSDFVVLSMQATPLSVRNNATVSGFSLPPPLRKGTSKSNASTQRSSSPPRVVPTIDTGVDLDTLRLGHVPLPLLHNGTLICEQELQLHLQKPLTEIFVDIKKIRWKEERIAAAGYEIYALCYLIDRDMQVLTTPEPATAGLEREVPTTPTRSSSILGFSRKPSKRSMSMSMPATASSTKAKPDYVHRTAVITAEEAYSFDSELIVLDTPNFPALEHAHYLLVEVWGKGGNSEGDEMIGEAIVPFQSGYYHSNSDQAVKQFLIRSCLASKAGTVSNVSPVSASSKHLFTLGNIDIKLYTKTDDDSPTVGMRSARLRGTHANVSLTMRPLQPSDCAWPAQILNEQGLENDVYFFSVLSHGLQVSMDLSLNNMIISDRVSVLEECEERTSKTSDKVLQLLIPYTKLESSKVSILSEHTLLIAITLTRMFPGGNKVIRRPVDLSFVIGPCLAEDMYACICNNIDIQDVRCHLINHFTYVDAEREESFNSLTRQLESNLYEASLKIEEFKQEQLYLQQFDPSYINMDHENVGLAIESNSFSQSSAQDSLEVGLENDSRYFLLESLMNRNIKAKILYLKVATVRIYLWYLLELTPAQFISEKHPLDTSWISFDEQSFIVDEATGNRTAATYTMEIETVVYKILEQMQQLENDIRYTIYRGHKNNYMDSSAALTRLVYHKYRAIIAFLLETLDTSVKVSDSPQVTVQKAMARKGVIKKNTNTINPQKKRDLIKFIITHDEIVENYTNYILQAHNYKFTKRPLLSICLNVDDLLQTFSGILESSLLSWNTRIVKHFLSEHLSTNNSSGSYKSTHSVYTPWEITTIYDKNMSKELYISNIPETIQLQLNVEIGLKKISLEEANKAMVHTNRSVESDLRIERMNSIIKQSIVLSYIYLAAEYENILTNYMTNTLAHLAKLEVASTYDAKSLIAPMKQHKVTKDPYAAPSKSKDSKKDIHSIKDEIIIFLVSIINDLYRINNTHIAQTIDQFLKDAIYFSQQAEQNSPNYVKKRMMAYMQRQQNRQSLTGQQRDYSRLSRGGSFFLPPNTNINVLIPNLTEKLSYYLSPASSLSSNNNVLSFPLCVKVMNSIIIKTVHELSNQLLLYSELKAYFFQGLDANIGSYAYAKQAMRIDHSPMEVIKASILDFLQFVQQYLVEEYMHALVYILMFKLTVRYWIFLRDYHEYRSKFSPNGALATPGQRLSLGGGGASGDEDAKVMVIWERDLKYIKSLFNEITNQILTTPNDATGSPHGAPETNADSMRNKYKLAAVSLLKKLSFSIMSALTNEWRGAEATNRFLSHNFGITCPSRVNSESPADSIAYFQALERFFSQESAFTHFTPVVISDDTADNIDIISGYGRKGSDAYAPRCNIVVNQLACVQVKKYKSVFLRIYLQNNLYELALQGNSGSVIGWSDAVKLDGVMMSLAKELKIELYGFQIRPWKAMRQRLIGTVVIDLGDIIRSSQQDSTTPSAVTTPIKQSGSQSFSHHLDGSFRHNMSFSMSMQGNNALLEAMYSSSSGRPSISTNTMLPPGTLAGVDSNAGMANGGDTVDVHDEEALCSHTAWYVFTPSPMYQSRVLRQKPTAAATAAGTRIGYIDSLAGVLAASKGPRTDTPLPQLRLHIQVTKA